jgi:hypothetical protein
MKIARRKKETWKMHARPRVSASMRLPVQIDVLKQVSIKRQAKEVLAEAW